jgi:hypothetical protein
LERLGLVIFHNPIRTALREGTLGCTTLGICVAEPARQKKPHPDGPGAVNPKAEVELQGGRCGLGCACKTIAEL